MTSALHTAIVSAVTQKALKATESTLFEISERGLYVDGRFIVGKKRVPASYECGAHTEYRHTVSLSTIIVFTEANPEGVDLEPHELASIEKEINKALE